MQSDTVTIYCPNPLCQAPNPESHKFCQHCRSSIPKRYLWAVGKGLANLRPGEFLSGRYLWKGDRIVLDTQPGVLPDFPTEISAAIEPYLRLSPFPLHIPQVYGVTQLAPKRPTGDIVLLERTPIYPEGVGQVSHIGYNDNYHSAVVEGNLMPPLATVWQLSNGLRQLHWLWQIAQLWQPLSTVGVASSLLQPDLLRVEGSLIRLLELQPDHRTTPTLANLGKLWQQWQAQASREIVDFLQQLCQQLQQGQVQSAEQLVDILDHALNVAGQTPSRQILLATQTDQGPSRQRNEDACYPPSGTVHSFTNPVSGASAGLPLAIVCDGIGGHDGGDVASNLAIATVQQKVQEATLTFPLAAATLVTRLEQATLIANDIISQRNDSEQRQERQRMGTTLVMALANTHELYLTHVGDSRAYRITTTGCHQVTLDDDLAAREVRLGYVLYREAVRQPGSGALVQALGMASSSLLHPTVQRFILDEDCLFLLCSDGLSDNERVEEYWQTELLPVLLGQSDVTTASQRLVELANTRNGHDNVTIALVHCQVTDNQPIVEPLDASLALGTAVLEPPTTPPKFNQTPVSRSTLKTELVPQRQASHPLLHFIGIIALLIMGGLSAYLLIPDVRAWLSPTSEPPPIPVAPVTPPPPPPPPSPPAPLQVGSLVQVNRLLPGQENQTYLLTLLPQPGRAKSSLEVSNLIPAETVLQIDRKQAIPQQGNWVKLKVCSVPVATPPGSRTIQPGSSGWVEETAIASLVTPTVSLPPAELKLARVNCTITNTPATNTPATNQPATNN